MTAIGPGTPLICIRQGNPDPGWLSKNRHNNITVGALYTCHEVIDRALVMDGTCPDCPGDCNPIQLKEKLTPDAWGSWTVYCPTLFRPLNDGDTSLVEKEKELEDHSLSPEQADARRLEPA